MEDLTGRKFKKWFVVKPSDSHKVYHCLCDCGEVKEVSRYTLLSGKSGSCGKCLSSHKKIEVGDEFTTNQGCKCVVVKYNGAFDVLVKFLDEHEHLKTVATGDLRRGEVTNPFFPSVFGVGYPGIDKSSLQGYKLRGTREHMFWKGMMERCYSESSLQRSPSYKGCTVDERWHNFQNFAEWCQWQVGFTEKGWQLDKDLLAEGCDSKTYSPDVCVFVPQEINTLFSTGIRGDRSSLLGVSYCNDRGKYQAGCGYGGVRKALGRFATEELAHSAYLEGKRARVSELLEKYKGKVDGRVVQLLSKFIVS